MNCVTPKIFADPNKTNPLLRPAKDRRRQADDILQDIALVLELTRRVKDEILEDKEQSVGV